MNEPTIDPIPDSGGLYALPSGGLDWVAAACLEARGGNPNLAKQPTNAADRVNLWRTMNEAMAEAVANAGENNSDLTRLNSVLGIATTTPTNTPDNFDAERLRLAARSKARAQCAAMLEAGYQP